MIINVSGRTDIVAFYTPWFLNRLKEGYVLVRNPFNPQLLSKIEMERVDLIVFCTKNPLPILPFLDQIHKPYLFQVTVTPYHRDIEPGVPDKHSILRAVQALSEMGVCHPAIRYDPILLNDRYTVSYHIRAFEKLCRELKGFVERIIVSFVDDYKNLRKHQEELRIRTVDDTDYQMIGQSFSQIASQYGMSVQTCFEQRNLCEYGFKQDVCLSVQEAYWITGKRFRTWKARPCGCVEMVDIGDYNTCRHFCKYCYANYDEGQIYSKTHQHDPNSPLLIGHVQPHDVIKVRK